MEGSMRAVLLAILLVLAGLSAAWAGTLELNPRYEPKRFQDRDTTVDPDTSVYGIGFGSTEAEVLAAFGEPQGIIVINDAKKTLLYGQSHLFTFRNGRLKELIVNDHILDWTLSKQMEEHRFFDRGKWTVKPGFRKDMTFAEVRTLLGRPDAVPDHRYVFDGERSSITLRFSRWHGQSGPEAYRLNGFSIVHYGE